MWCCLVCDHFLASLIWPVALKAGASASSGPSFNDGTLLVGWAYLVQPLLVFACLAASKRVALVEGQATTSPDLPQCSPSEPGRSLASAGTASSASGLRRHRAAPSAPSRSQGSRRAGAGGLAAAALFRLAPLHDVARSRLVARSRRLHGRDLFFLGRMRRLPLAPSLPAERP